jgi:predicted ribosome quality control (RQC) complex YloA/Tae2 family protein
VKNLRDRTARKLIAQSEELKATYDRERLREQGDIIKANLHNMQKGMSMLKAQDFYSEDGAEAEIPLDPKLSPQQNAAKYYKAYAKAKNAETVLSELIRSAADELNYWKASEEYREAREKRIQ